MTQAQTVNQPGASRRRRPLTHETWMEQQGIPIHRGYYIEDLRTVELGWWKAREHDAAFIQLEGMRGITEVRVTEIPAGGTLAPLKLGFDEVVYVLQGYGITSLTGQGGKDTRSFEWQPHSMFLLPRHYTHQFTNTRGDVAVRLMHFNYMPAGMSGSNNPNFFFNNSFEEPEQTLDQIYSQARVEHVGADPGMDPYLWYGNFFPDMAAWDKLGELQNRGAGGHHVQFQFPDTEIYGHMSVFEPRLYKKAHRHGPGVAIVIPMGEGFSIMWPEGGEKVVAPWHEGSFFVPPDRWYHQHFNVGGTSARYIAFSASPQFGIWERVRDANDQIEYPEEEPWIREKFEGELEKRGITTLMPEEVYKDRLYKWEPRGSYAPPV